MSEIRYRPFGRASTERFRLRDATTGQFASGTALSAGDAKISIDGGALANVATLPTYDASSGQWVWSATASEMTGKRITLLVTNAAYLGFEKRFETNGDARAQVVPDGMFHSTSASSITANGCTLGGAPAVLPDGAYAIRYVDVNDATLAEVYMTLSGTTVTHVTALSAAPTGVDKVHLFSLPKDTPVATTANTFADALLDRTDAIASGMTLRMHCRLMLQTAGARGKSSGAAGTTGAETITFYHPDGTTPVLSVPTDQFGNRTAAATVNTSGLSGTGW
jgi:hypothetical protein